MKQIILVGVAASLLAACASVPQRSAQVDQARAEIDTPNRSAGGVAVPVSVARGLPLANRNIHATVRLRHRATGDRLKDFAFGGRLHDILGRRVG